ncbi:tetraacyldisaccharide 4'-kinase [Occallatibacter savannae]|uniref:tetraacyldisaccharide 4'-kinase n=1 Tax=Occallatibacter savannae TaxID=1002691 RepID=UPI000D697167|nr:tetraacyldisaccharide 4'-kinase [Occallatibacter savannae]
MRRPLLLPLMPLYAAGVALREWKLERGWEQVRRLRWPVISVGNLSAGGAGKTPLVIALARLLTNEGWRVDVLSRGYGRESRGAARVRSDGSADEFGDEPLLIAQKTGVPVWVAAERYEAGQLAESELMQAGETSAESASLVHLLDDGFQHRQLYRDVDVVLVNRQDCGDYLLPAGDLREPVEALGRASVLAIPASDHEFEEELRVCEWSGPVWRVRRRMRVPEVEGAVAAFCGIARPEQFFAGLEARGMQVVCRRVFADHHRYSQRDVEGLLQCARKAGAQSFITTEKDHVRLGALRTAFGERLRTAELLSEFDDEASVAAWLKERLAGRQLAQDRNATEKHTTR